MVALLHDSNSAAECDAAAEALTLRAMGGAAGGGGVADSRSAASSRAMRSSFLPLSLRSREASISLSSATLSFL